MTVECRISAFEVPISPRKKVQPGTKYTGVSLVGPRGTIWPLESVKVVDKKTLRLTDINGMPDTRVGEEINAVRIRNSRWLPELGWISDIFSLDFRYVR